MFFPLEPRQAAAIPCHTYPIDASEFDPIIIINSLLLKLLFMYLFILITHALETSVQWYFIFVLFCFLLEYIYRH